MDPFGESVNRLSTLIWSGLERYGTEKAHLEHFQGGDAGSNPAGVTNPFKNLVRAAPRPDGGGKCAAGARWARSVVVGRGRSWADVRPARDGIPQRPRHPRPPPSRPAGRVAHPCRGRDDLARLLSGLEPGRYAVGPAMADPWQTALDRVLSVMPPVGFNFAKIRREFSLILSIIKCKFYIHLVEVLYELSLHLFRI